jgi:RNA polymerase sigma-70 factor (ECF subfamily)
MYRTGYRTFWPRIGEPPPPPRTFGCVAGSSRTARRWHDHDPVRFDQAVRPHLSGAVRAAARLAGSEDLGWDAAQEALLSLWNTAERPPNLAAWLTRAARHRALHMQRTLARSRRRELVAVGDRPEERGYDPSLRCERCELLSAFEEALARLPEEQREAFRLCELEERDYQEAARLAGVPVGTIRSRLHRARAALQLALAWTREDFG